MNYAKDGFCEKHFEPRLAFIRNLQAIDGSPEVRALYYTEMQRENGHLDSMNSSIALAVSALPSAFWILSGTTVYDDIHRCLF